MSCKQCSGGNACSCPESDVQKTQSTLGNHVLLSTLVTCKSLEIDSDVDVVDVVAAGVTVTLPTDPVPLKSYRIVASGGDVTVVALDECCNPLPIPDNIVPAGTSRDFTFSEALGRWVPACCGEEGALPDLAALIGPQGVQGLIGAIGPQGVQGLVGAIGPAGVAGLVGGIGPQGIAGLVGLLGLQGLIGLTGAIGPAGVTGLVGAIGPQGIAGLIGEQGIQGIAGIVGPEGVAGVVGEIGQPGPPGPAGPEGPEGPPGPAGGLGGEYAYVYNITAETVAIEDPIDFDTNGIMSAGISHAPGSPVITLAVGGIYEVTYVVAGVEPNQFALFVDGAPLPESTYGSGVGTQPNVGHLLIQVGAGTELTLVNHSSAAAVTLQTLAGGTQPNVNASILIRQVAP